jgi:hypothetical protein
MFGHIVDHFVLTSRILSERTKWITYGVLMLSIVANFWWFRGMALGIDGPIKDYWGVHWRKVCLLLLGLCTQEANKCYRVGISTICSRSLMVYILVSSCLSSHFPSACISLGLSPH